jgi:pyridoxine 4-dehydrogenase
MSLRRLRVERIDLYQLHRIDPKVPVEDTLLGGTSNVRPRDLGRLGLQESRTLKKRF